MSAEMKKDYEDSFLEAVHDYDKQNEMEEKAKKIVTGFTGSTGATGAIPLPFADAPLLIAQQMAMMVAISKVYDIQLGEEAAKSLAVAALGTGGVTVLGKTIATNLIKMVPGAGSVVGGAISAGTAGVLTLALGHAYIDVCKKIKKGQLSEDALTRKEGIETLKQSLKAELKKEKAKDK